MTNTNCLKGVRCPKCGFEDKFIIHAKVDVEVTDEGTEDAGGEYYWDDTHYCKCTGCKYEGTLADFTIEYQEHPEKREPAPPSLVQPVAEMIQSCTDIIDGLDDCQTYDEDDDAEKTSEKALLGMWRDGMEKGHFTIAGLNHISECLNKSLEFLEKLREGQMD